MCQRKWECKILLLLFSVSMLSCDPGIGVAIANKSKTEKRVEVHYPSKFRLPADYRFPHNDSIRMYEIGRKDNYMYPLITPIVSMDTNARVYTFVLKPGYEALVESRIVTALPTFGQVFVIDNRDTVVLTRHGKSFIRTERLLLVGGKWTYMIKDE